MTKKDSSLIAQTLLQGDLKPMSDDEAEVQIAYGVKLYEALRYLAEGLKPIVEQQLQQRYRDAWEDNVCKVKGHATNLADPYVLLATINDKWDSAFDGLFKDVRHRVVVELYDTRNAANHSEPFTAEAVDNSISSMLRMLHSIPTSQKSIKMAGKIKQLREQTVLNANEGLTPVNDEGVVSPDAAEQHNAPETQAIAVPEAIAGIIKDNPKNQQLSIEGAEKPEANMNAPSAQSLPTITYNFSRLCFKASQIEPLQDDQAFRVITPVGTFQMTKAEFRKSFPKVILSKSYSENGIYHYPSVPKSALIYKLPQDLEH